MNKMIISITKKHIKVEAILIKFADVASISTLKSPSRKTLLDFNFNIALNKVDFIGAKSFS